MSVGKGKNESHRLNIPSRVDVNTGEDLRRQTNDISDYRTQRLPKLKQRGKGAGKARGE